jgi:hypothetical protein
LVVTVRVYVIVEVEEEQGCVRGDDRLRTHLPPTATAIVSLFSVSFLSHCLFLRF